ncbi:MAG: amidohydrolase family protein [Rhizobiaceae bacterium]
MSDLKAIDYWTNIFTPAGLRKMYVENDELAPVVEWWGMSERIRGYEPADFVRLLDELNIEKTYVPSFKMWSYVKKTSQFSVDVDEVRALMDACGGKVGGLYGIDITKGMDGVREMRRAVRDWGFEGAHLHSYGWGIPLNHRDLYPFYAECVELDVPVIVQCGHAAEKMPSEMGRPIWLDDVALYFPELRIVASHTGWPWVQELIALAWKHKNLFIGGGAHAPKYWDPALVHFLNNRGRGKVLWGTDFPVVLHRESLEQVERIEMRPESRQALMRGAAEAVFKTIGGTK